MLSDDFATPMSEENEINCDSPLVDDSAVVPASVCRLVEQLDAKWERRFESLGELLKKSRGESEASEPPSKRAKSVCAGVSRPGTAHNDLSLDNEGIELQEDQLCSGNPSASVDDETESDSLLRGIEEEFNMDEKTGEKVHDRLANIVNERFKNRLDDEVLKKRFAAHNRPENCGGLVVPSVNREIWAQVPLSAKKADLKMAQTQRCIVKAATAVARVTNDLIRLDHSKAGEEMKRNCTDAIALLGHAARDISLRRRAAFKPHLNRSLHRLCDDPMAVPSSEKLFGENLPAVLRDVKELDRLDASITPGTSRSTWVPQSGRPAFLGRGRGRRPDRRAYSYTSGQRGSPFPSHKTRGNQHFHKRPSWQ